MIRSAPIRPAIRTRLGDTVSINGTAYTFTDGLSSDPSLPAYLQDLTPSQLQTALSGGTPSITDVAGTPFTFASCSNPAQYDPTICGPGGPGATNPLFMNDLSQKLQLPSVPSWVWWGIAGVGAVLLLRGSR